MAASGFQDTLWKPTSILGLRLWVVLAISIGAAFVVLLFLFFITLWITTKRNNNKKSTLSSSLKTYIPIVSKEIPESRVDPTRYPTQPKSDEDEKRDHVEVGKGYGTGRRNGEARPGCEKRLHVEVVDGKLVEMGNVSSYGEARPGEEMRKGGVSEVSHLGWGHWYTLRELEVATNGFAKENVIGEGGYGIVYHGLMEDNVEVAVKNLLNNRGQAEREFKVEVEAIGRVRHKNLVRLLGYCAQGAHRMLVYEYVDNGNLEQWLHGDLGLHNPLTWELRMKVILGTAKGLTYLHEGLEPKVVHRDIKSSNILLDKQWNPFVSDFGVAKLLGSDKSYITTRVMGTFGYVAPEYASTGMLNERSDVYSFGILIMEIITGRNPVDYNRSPQEVNLVDWLKKMVSNRNTDGVLDSKLPIKPSSRALKRTLLIALRCVDPNAQNRPKMGQVIHMLEADEFPFRVDDRGNGKDYSRAHRDIKDRVKKMIESGDSSGYESSIPTNWSLLRKQETDED